MLTSLLLGLCASLAGALLAHRGGREGRPWLVLGLAPQVGAVLLALLGLVTLSKPLLVYGLLGFALVVGVWPGPSLQRPRPALTAVCLLLLALTAGTALLALDDRGWRPLATARFLRGWQGWPGPGLDVLLAALGWPECDPLAIAWSVRWVLRLGGALVLAGLPAHPVLGLLLGLTVPWLPDVAPLGIYLTVRLAGRTLPLPAAPFLATLPLVSPVLMPWWWLAGALVCLVRRAGVPALLAFVLCLPWPWAGWRLPYPTWSRPLLPEAWRRAHQGLTQADGAALDWLAVNALPHERVLSERAELDGPLQDRTGLEPAPRDAVWAAFRHTGRADLLQPAGVSWLWLDVTRRSLRSPLLTPGPRHGPYQLFGVLPAGDYRSDYRYPCRVTLPRELKPAHVYDFFLDVTNHDRVSRRLGWLRVQVVGQSSLDLLAGRGRMAPEGGDRLTLPLVTPTQPGNYVLEILQPHTSEGRPWRIAQVPFTVAP